MGKYIAKRFALAIITGIIILTLVFLLTKSLPLDKPVGNDSARNAYWTTEVDRGYVTRAFKILKGQTPVDIITLNGKKIYYYAAPVMQQYFKWAGNIILHWDWGVSQQISINRTAISLIGEQLPYSIRINLLSAVVAIPLGIALGIWAALKKNKPTDSIISTLIMIFISVPSFILITFVLRIFCYGSAGELLPSQWDDTTPIMALRSLVIPVMCLSFGSIAGYGRTTRAELCEVMSSEYLLLARTKGLTKGQAIRRHALRNAMVPIVPGIVAEIIAIFTGGSMIIEQLYGIPGIGQLYVKALNAKDWNIMFVIMAFDVVIGLSAGILIDISYGIIDPRIRMGAKK